MDTGVYICELSQGTRLVRMFRTCGKDVTFLAAFASRFNIGLLLALFKPVKTQC